MKAYRLSLLLPIALLFPHFAAGQGADDAAACAALAQARNLTILSAELRENSVGGEPYCYVRGLTSPAIHWHAQLPLPRNWNGRFLQWGDGGKDGDLDFADHRVAEGYAVANSNTGHDNGAEPGSSFGFDNREAEIDFGYRAVHLTVQAGKSLVNGYYGQRPAYSYFEGCSTGGRQGLMEAQRYPDDFDGIVAGAPVNFYQAMNAAGVWHLQRMFRNDFAGNLAVDADGDGSRENTDLVRILNDAVIEKCDGADGVRDGVLGNPLACEIEPERDLAQYACGDSGNSRVCFNEAQMATIADFYRGPYGSDGAVIYPGKTKGSELDWIGLFIPGAHNDLMPGMLAGPAGDHVNYLFYEQDPGVTIPVLNDMDYEPRTSGPNPEFHWMDFQVDDFLAGRAELMSGIMDATDPNLEPFLLDRGGKLIVYHGLNDALSVATATIGYFENMVDTTFAGDYAAAGDHARLFLAPGMGHCRGGPGPDTWDRLLPLVDWVENGVVPESIVATHSSDGEIDNERPLCAYPENAVYVGPPGAADNPANWTAANFSCR